LEKRPRLTNTKSLKKQLMLLYRVNKSIYKLHTYTDSTVHMILQTMIQCWIGIRTDKRRFEITFSNQSRSVTEILKPGNKSKDDARRDHGDTDLRI
jgi:hypothetical protein